ncbi:MAG: helix-turn-helix domain-containing protein [Verrucomicrobiaceae bacterium]|nr:helix-turn-helix domain-containing protein [Verrucomicrobiaceae bacterium]
MESHEVLRKAIDKASPKEIAAELGVSLSLVYKWSQPSDEEGGSGTTNPLDRVVELFRLTQDDFIIQWLCRKSGGFFVKNPNPTKGNFDLMPTTQSIVQMFAELLSAISRAASDHQISEKEASEIRHEWDELKRFTEGFVHCCEKGDFAGMERMQHELEKRWPAHR